MPLLFVILAACGVALAMCGRAGGAAAPTDTAGARGRVVRVMTFNVHHGIDGTSRYNLQRAIDTIARLQPDVVGLQEVTRNHPSYGCHDQPAMIVDGLRRATGRPWHHAYVPSWTVHTDRSCLERGLGDGPNTEGLAVLAPEPIQWVSSQRLPNSRIGLAARVPSMAGIPLVVTHLANGAAGAADRERQLQVLLPWAEAQGLARVLVGDVNARPDAPELAAVRRIYRDAWGDAAAAGRARGVPNGATRGSARVDYIFFTPGPGLRVEWAEIVDTAALIGVRASDHEPVVAALKLDF